MPKRNDDSSSAAIVADLLSEKQPLALRLHACKALVAKGDSLGFTTLISTIE